MNVNLAIQHLEPFHNAQLIWVVPGTNCVDPTTNQFVPPTAQLTTGLEDEPLIPVDSGMVCADDLFDVVDKLSKQLQLA